ncbi:MAG: hypothetical protein PHY99_06855, partial [Bacteroidales bacterium]|nr:hypothetical protein [Bacteroidales bacterium]
PADVRLRERARALQVRRQSDPEERRRPRGLPEHADYHALLPRVYGAIVNKTSVDGILALNCNVTDFYAANKYPVYLYYNPYQEDKTVTWSSDSPVDLYDAVTKKYLTKGKRGNIKFSLPAGEASLVYVLPEGTRLKSEELKP